MAMELEQRQAKFFDRVRTLGGFNKQTWKFSKLFGVSNSAKVLEGGMQLGVTNLESWGAKADGAVFCCLLRYPPGDEVYFAVYVKTGIEALIKRLKLMIGPLAKEKDQDVPAADVAAADMAEDEGDATSTLKYAQRNNNSVLCLADDGNIYVRNKGFWDSLNFDRSQAEPAVMVDRIICAVYPPNPSAHRSLLAREFVGYLIRLVGRDRVEELYDVWPEEATVSPAMKRMPGTIPVTELQEGIRQLGGHYGPDLVERYHVALNHLASKHFVILTGISGTGKTGIVDRYARVVHGVTGSNEKDPFLFMCPVRPDWTDPSGLTGYFDVISNKYVVPEFLRAVLTAHAHPESPIFVCIDEMNLARVEYYLADVLSAMESDSRQLHLHGHSVPLQGSTGGYIPPVISLPSNLFIIGTINVDESTQSISDKVLDRASLIDMSEVDLDGFEALLRERLPELDDSVDACMPLLKQLYTKLAGHRLGFGYRVAEEFIRYFDFASTATQQQAPDIIDHQICQKILVKLRGGERQRELLDSLADLLKTYPLSLAIVEQLKRDLSDYGSFQYAR